MWEKYHINFGFDILKKCVRVGMISKNIFKAAVFESFGYVQSGHQILSRKLIVSQIRKTSF